MLKRMLFKKAISCSSYSCMKENKFTPIVQKPYQDLLLSNCTHHGVEELIFSGTIDTIQLTSGGTGSFFSSLQSYTEKEIWKYGIPSKCLDATRKASDGYGTRFSLISLNYILDFIMEKNIL